MKLSKFERHHGYQFTLYFDNGEVRDVDLQPLLGAYVPEAMLSTARIDPEWGCLELNQGAVDIEPQTLYRFAH